MRGLLPAAYPVQAGGGQESPQLTHRVYQVQIGAGAPARSLQMPEGARSVRLFDTPDNLEYCVDDKVFDEQLTQFVTFNATVALNDNPVQGGDHVILRRHPGPGPLGVLIVGEDLPLDWWELLRHEWPEPEVQGATIIDNASGYTAGATSWAVVNGSQFQAGDVLWVPASGELVLVGGVSGNTLTGLTRGYDGTAAASVVDEQPILGFRPD